MEQMVQIQFLVQLHQPVAEMVLVVIFHIQEIVPLMVVPVVQVEVVTVILHQQVV
jgi:hypothetical protein